MLRKKGGKFFRHIFILISIFVFLIFLIFSSVLYFQSYRTISNYARENNKQAFTQINFNVSNMNQNIVNTSSFLYNNQTALKFMEDYSNRDSEIYDHIIEFRKLVDPIINNNNFIHSIYVFNYHTDSLFSSYRNINYRDEELLQILKSGETVPFAMPFYRVVKDLSSGTGYSRVLTYVYYEGTTNNQIPKGAVVINVKYDAIRKNLDELNQTDSDSNGVIILLNQKKELLEGKRRYSNSIQKAAEDIKVRLKNEKNTDLEYHEFSTEIDDKRYMIAYDRIETTNWLIARIEPYQILFQHLYRLIITMVIIIILFTFLIFIISYRLSRNIYKPLNRLMTKFKSYDLSGDEEDEFAFLSAVYDEMQGKLKQTAGEETTKLSYIFFLKSALLSEKGLESELSETLQKYNQPLFSTDGNICTCVILIDDYQEFTTKFHAQDQKLVKYAICNILSELLSEAYVNEVFDMGKDEIAAIIKISGEQEFLSVKNIKKCMEQTCSLIKSRIEITFSASISAFYHDINQLPESYYQSKNHVQYRYLFGKNCVITNEMAESNDRNPVHGISDAMLRNLLKYIKAEDMEKAEQQLNQIFEEIRYLSFRNIKNSIMILTANVFSVLDESKHRMAEQSLADYSDRYAEILQMETCEEICDEILHEIQIHQKDNSKTLQKNELIVCTVKKIVENDFADQSLCLQKISAQLQMSDQYLGRVFKMAVGISVSDYINEVRLRQAVLLMETSRGCMAQIAEKVGITSEGQFYRLFKKKFGLTPRNYLLYKAEELRS